MTAVRSCTTSAAPGCSTTTATTSARSPLETGFFRPQPEGAIEVLLTHPTGYAEIYYGTVEGAKIELATDAVARTTSAKEYRGGHRLYGLVEGDLLWTFDMAAVGQELQSHIWARLQRDE